MRWPYQNLKKRTGAKNLPHFLCMSASMPARIDNEHRSCSRRVLTQLLMNSGDIVSVPQDETFDNVPFPR